MLKCYKVAFDSGQTTEINTPKVFTEDYIKSEIEKITDRTVVKVQILENAKKYDPNKIS